MIRFKDMLMQDSQRVFHNPEEFAVVSDVEYLGKHYSIPIITEEAGTARRDLNNNQRKNDNEKSLWQYDIYFWMSLHDLGEVPRRNREIRVNRRRYEITDVYEEYGELQIRCRRLNE